MTGADHRRAELIAAAATNDLSPDEERELAAIIAEDPTARAEIDELAAVADRLYALDSWTEIDQLPAADNQPTEVGARSLDRTATRRSGSSAAQAQPVPSGPRRISARLGLIAAALTLVIGLAIGAIGGHALGRGGGDEVAIPTGPPGTLGAHEPVVFTPSDVEAVAEIQAVVIAHTWGTETVLDIVGLEPGDTYHVVFIDRSGREVSAGAFLGSDVPIHCAMNGAVLREDVAELQIMTADGSVLREAALPEA